MESSSTNNWQIVMECDDDEPPSWNLEPFLGDLQRTLGFSGQVCILFCDPCKIQALNAQFRGKDKVTDVLSFPAAPIPGVVSDYLGDLAICVAQAQSQAQRIGHELEEEVRFLILHGVLHLLGYDHETDQGEMLELQQQTKMRMPAYFSHEVSC